jgi:hypothetical protein
VARPEVLDRTVKQCAALADFLRARRASAGLIYAELRLRTGIPEATLKRAADGKPSRSGPPSTHTRFIPTPMVIWPPA